MHTANQRSHIRGGTGTGDKDKVPPQAFPTQRIGTEKIAGAGDDVFRSQNSNVETGKQADKTGVAAVNANAD